MGQDAHAVMSKLRPWLLRRAQRLSRAGVDAEDLVQETLMDFGIKFRDRPISERGAMAYLATVLKHQFLLRRRSIGVRERAVDDPALTPTVEAPAPDDVLGSSVLVTDDELEEAIRTLSEKQLEVFRLSSQGVRYAEIAARLGIREGTVAKRVFDARQQLRRRLSEIVASRRRAQGP